MKYLLSNSRFRGLKIGQKHFGSFIFKKTASKLVKDPLKSGSPRSGDTHSHKEVMKLLRLATINSFGKPVVENEESFHDQHKRLFIRRLQPPLPQEADWISSP